MTGIKISISVSGSIAYGYPGTNEETPIQINGVKTKTNMARKA